MVHLSVAVGRFFEAIFYGILRVAGMTAAVIIGICLVGLILFLIARWMLKRRR